MASAWLPVGRIWFQTRSGWSTCSGAVVSHDLVLTAGHCVRNGATGRWYRNFIFQPGLYGDTHPPFAANFYGTTTYTTNTWGNSSAPYFYPRDFAFIRIRGDAVGHNIGDWTGGWSMRINAPLYQRVFHVGYPSEGGFDGCNGQTCWPWYCDSQIQVFHSYAALGTHGSSVGFSCVTTGGASGGPVFQNVDGADQIVSVMSHFGDMTSVVDPATGRSHRESNTMYGPHLSTTAASLFAYAQTH
jgi:V8-like Glu-specific endopeptidase